MTINLPFNKLSHWQYIAFSAALLERMLPNYQLFSQHTGFGSMKILRNQLDLIWQWLDKSNRCNINYEAQISKLDEQIPDPDAFDFFGVYPAIDASMALLSLLQLMQNLSGDNLADVSKLSQNSVSYFVELSLAEVFDNNVITQENILISAEKINNHPLMQWEIATQNELFDFLKFAAENKYTCDKAKQLVLEEGVSNLGIELT